MRTGRQIWRSRFSQFLERAKTSHIGKLRVCLIIQKIGENKAKRLCLTCYAHHTQTHTNTHTHIHTRTYTCTEDQFNQFHAISYLVQYVPIFLSLMLFIYLFLDTLSRQAHFISLSQYQTSAGNTINNYLPSRPASCSLPSTLHILWILVYLR